MIRALIFDLCDTVVRTAGLPGLANLPGAEIHRDAHVLERWLRERRTRPVAVS